MAEQQPGAAPAAAAAAPAAEPGAAGGEGATPAAAEGPTEFEFEDVFGAIGLADFDAPQYAEQQSSENFYMKHRFREFRQKPGEGTEEVAGLPIEASSAQADPSVASAQPGTEGAIGANAGAAAAAAIGPGVPGAAAGPLVPGAGPNPGGIPGAAVAAGAVGPGAPALPAPAKLAAGVSAAVSAMQGSNGAEDEHDGSLLSPMRLHAFEMTCKGLYSVCEYFSCLRRWSEDYKHSPSPNEDFFNDKRTLMIDGLPLELQFDYEFDIHDEVLNGIDSAVQMELRTSSKARAMIDPFPKIPFDDTLVLKSRPKHYEEHKEKLLRYIQKHKKPTDYRHIHDLSMYSSLYDGYVSRVERMMACGDPRMRFPCEYEDFTLHEFGFPQTSKSRERVEAMSEASRFRREHPGKLSKHADPSKAKVLDPVTRRDRVEGRTWRTDFGELLPSLNPAVEVARYQESMRRRHLWSEASFKGGRRKAEERRKRLLNGQSGEDGTDGDDENAGRATAPEHVIGETGAILRNEAIRVDYTRIPRKYKDLIRFNQKGLCYIRFSFMDAYMRHGVVFNDRHPTTGQLQSFLPQKTPRELELLRRERMASAVESRKRGPREIGEGSATAVSAHTAAPLSWEFSKDEIKGDLNIGAERAYEHEFGNMEILRRDWTRMNPIIFGQLTEKEKQRCFIQLAKQNEVLLKYSTHSHMGCLYYPTSMDLRNYANRGYVVDEQTKLEHHSRIKEAMKNGTYTPFMEKRRLYNRLYFYVSSDTKATDKARMMGDKFTIPRLSSNKDLWTQSIAVHYGEQPLHKIDERHMLDALDTWYFRTNRGAGITTSKPAITSAPSIPNRSIVSAGDLLRQHSLVKTKVGFGGDLIGTGPSGSGGMSVRAGDHVFSGLLGAIGHKPSVGPSGARSGGGGIGLSHQRTHSLHQAGYHSRATPSELLSFAGADGYQMGGHKAGKSNWFTGTICVVFPRHAWQLPCGLWSRSAALFDNLHFGSMVGYAEECERREWTIIMLNPNKNVIDTGDGKTVATCKMSITAPFHRTTQEHALNVFDDVVLPLCCENPHRKVLFVAHGDGSSDMMHVVEHRKLSCKQFLKGVAFIDCYHVWDESPLDFLIGRVAYWHSDPYMLNHRLNVFGASKRGGGVTGLTTDTTADSSTDALRMFRSRFIERKEDESDESYEKRVSYQSTAFHYWTPNGDVRNSPTLNLTAVFNHLSECLSFKNPFDSEEESSSEDASDIEEVLYTDDDEDDGIDTDNEGRRRVNQGDETEIDDDDDDEDNDDENDGISGRDRRRRKIGRNAELDEEEEEDPMDAEDRRLRESTEDMFLKMKQHSMEVGSMTAGSLDFPLGMELMGSFGGGSRRGNSIGPGLSAISDDDSIGHLQSASMNL